MPDSVREYLRSLALVLAIAVEVLRDFSAPIVGLLAPWQWLEGGAAAVLIFLLGFLVGRRRATHGATGEAPTATPARPRPGPSAATREPDAEARLMDVSRLREGGIEAGPRRRR